MTKQERAEMIEILRDCYRTLFTIECEISKLKIKIGTKLDNLQDEQVLSNSLDTFGIIRDDD